jgi:hypothetical protein
MLDWFNYYSEATGDQQFEEKLNTGYQLWKNTFFLADGTPRNHDYKTLPIDIQCFFQAIDSLVLINDGDLGNLPQALNVAKWAIENMLDRTGYLYDRR